jgi:hypothetical protein
MLYIAVYKLIIHIILLCSCIRGPVYFIDGGKGILFLCRSTRPNLVDDEGRSDEALGGCAGASRKLAVTEVGSTRW